MIKHSLRGLIVAVLFCILHRGLAGEPPAAVPLLPGAHYFDVTQPPYLAVPDDDSDDTLAIQRALSDAAAAAAAAWMMNS